jgi:hypothetical protein
VRAGSAAAPLHHGMPFFFLGARFLTCEPRPLSLWLTARLEPIQLMSLPSSARSFHVLLRTLVRMVG